MGVALQRGSGPHASTPLAMDPEVDWLRGAFGAPNLAAKIPPHWIPRIGLGSWGVLTSPTGYLKAGGILGKAELYNLAAI